MKRRITYNIRTFIEKDNIESVDLPYFDPDSYKYILKIDYLRIDMSVGAYASDLGMESIEYEFSDKFSCWAMYESLKKK